MSQDDPNPINEYVRRLPAPPLRPLVAWYSGYRQTGLRPGQHRGLPSPYLTLILTLDEPLSLAAQPDPRQTPGEYDAVVGGLHTSPVLITQQGRQSGMQLALSPLGARALLGLPAGELTGVVVDVADVLGPIAHEMHERVRTAATWSERFAVLDELLLQHARLEHSVSAEVAQAWRRLLGTGGTVAVSDLAREVGWSSRHLGNRFHVEVGLTPKAAARVVRFDRARWLLQRRVVALHQPRLADLAVASGYYDQAHLDREFRALAGCSPRWLAEEFRNVQAARTDAAADS
jgi:AraC-like DNA-binding protein